MKKITSTTGSTIKFLLSGSQPLEINEEGVIVSDSDALILEDRLGMQLKIVDVNVATHTREEIVEELGEEKVAEIEATAELLEE